jgi:hypothetical protein
MIGHGVDLLVACCAPGIPLPNGTVEQMSCPSGRLTSRRPRTIVLTGTRRIAMLRLIWSTFVCAVLGASSQAFSQAAFPKLILSPSVVVFSAGGAVDQVAGSSPSSASR